MTDAEIDKLEDRDLRIAFRQHVAAKNQNCHESYFVSLGNCIVSLPDGWRWEITNKTISGVYTCVSYAGLHESSSDANPTVSLLRSALRLAMKLKEYG